MGKKEQSKLSKERFDKGVIYAAVITALASIFASVAAAALTSYWNTLSLVDQRVNEIAASGLDARNSNVDYKAERAGLVVVNMRASGREGVRLAAAYGFLEGEKIATGAAQDASVDGVPSISETSFVMPVPKGGMWRVETKQPSHVDVNWFSPIPLAAD